MAPFTRKNRFDVQIVFPDIAIGIKNRTDVELTPDQVVTELEKFCARFRNRGKVPPAADAVDPQAPDTGKSSTREEDVPLPFSPTDPF